MDIIINIIMAIVNNRLLVRRFSECKTLSGFKRWCDGRGEERSHYTCMESMIKCSSQYQHEQHVAINEHVL